MAYHLFTLPFLESLSIIYQEPRTKNQSKDIKD